MKKLIALVAILSSGSLFAEDDGDNTYGLLQVNSSDIRSFVAIPWLGASTTNGEIAVADVVRTADLAEGDTINYYNGEKYESWQLDSDKKWIPATEVSDTIVAGTDPDKKVLKRGNALILMRRTSHSAPFYLWGQVASSVPTNVIARSGDAKVSSLIGPPMETVDINNSSDVEWSNVNKDDRIYFQTPTNKVECKLIDNVWKNYCVTGITELGALKIKVVHYAWVEPGPIGVGTGFWYSATNGTETTKVIWKGAPKVTPKVN